MSSHPALVTLATTLVLSSAISAQLAITEVLVDPVGTNAGKQIVEVTNITNSTFTPTGWWICAPFTYASIPQVAIPAGGVVKFHIGATGTNSKTDSYFPFFRALGTTDVFMLYKDRFFHLNGGIIDFVSWGGGAGRIGQAVAVKVWESTKATVTLPKGEGKTIQWDGRAHASTSWVADAAASLGSKNDIATATPFGGGCGGARGTPQLAVAAGQRPKLGGGFSLELGPLPTSSPSLTQLIVGVSRTTWNTNKLPLDLGPFGAPSCNLRVSFDLLLPLSNTGGKVTQPLSVPNQARLKGIRFFLQAYALDSSANALQVVVSNGLEGLVGN